ncbi:hypothetical protein AVEN_71269-1 [Araneus ventricosus]|uniref:Uncharacterized protein n=1 Tax=Araneus ventricosus TaxID=182803 RepID=A0A4Y2CX14_ARAVE|nr:hypothetical protein AVEN_71269-1 [Araneus ventricosus]
MLMFHAVFDFTLVYEPQNYNSGIAGRRIFFSTTVHSLRDKLVTKLGAKLTKRVLLCNTPTQRASPSCPISPPHQDTPAAKNELPFACQATVLLMLSLKQKNHKERKKRNSGTITVLVRRRHQSCGEMAIWMADVHVPLMVAVTNAKQVPAETTNNEEVVHSRPAKKKALREPLQDLCRGDDRLQRDPFI